MPTLTFKDQEKRLLQLELATLLVLSLLTLWSIRPLLEEWGLFVAFNAQGLGFIREFAANIPLRPLHLVPTALYWELLHGRTSGVATGTLLLMLLRYLVVRWAVSPLLHGQDRWIVATLAAVLLGWPGAWLGRFAPAQFSAFFFFAAMGFAIRLHQQWSLRTATGCIASILVLLLTYQALALCLVTLPLFALLWAMQGQAQIHFNRLADRRAEIRVAITIVIAFAIYGIYAVIVSHGANGGGYEANLAESSGHLLTISGLSAHIGRAYLTVFGATPSLFPLLVLLALQLSRGGQSTTNTAKPTAIPASLVILLVAALPLFALIYLNEGHIHDPDRVMYPVSVAFVVLIASLMAWRHVPGLTTDRSHSVVIVSMLLVAAAVSAYHVKKYATVQRQVIKQTVAAIDVQHPQSVVIQDATGELGDVYTLLNPTLRDALAANGHPVNAVICTLSAVDRIHPDAQRYPISTTSHCEDVPAQPSPVLVLVARRENDMITLRP